MINSNLKNKIYGVFAYDIKETPTPTELNPPTFDKDIDVNIDEILNKKGMDPYRVCDKIAVENHFII
jgi:hypothetical protein